MPLAHLGYCLYPTHFLLNLFAMSQSLADQLIQAGLAKPEQAQKRVAKKNKVKRKQNHRGSQPANKQGKPTKNQAQPVNTSVVNLLDAPPANKQQVETERRHVLNLKIAQLFAQHNTAHPKGDSTYSYQYQNKIKRIYLSEQQRQQLIAGDLAITVFKAKTTLIPADIINELLAIDPARFVHHAQTHSLENTQENTSENTPDDPHAVPDDLIW